MQEAIGEDKLVVGRVAIYLLSQIESLSLVFLAAGHSEDEICQGDIDLFEGRMAGKRHLNIDVLLVLVPFKGLLRFYFYHGCHRDSKIIKFIHSNQHP
jgi:hypothetical protein